MAEFLRAGAHYVNLDQIVHAKVYRDELDAVIAAEITLIMTPASFENPVLVFGPLAQDVIAKLDARLAA